MNETVRSVVAFPDTDVCQAAHHWRLRGLGEEAELSGTQRVPSGLLIHNLVRADHVFPKCGPVAVCTKTMSALNF